MKMMTTDDFFTYSNMYDVSYRIMEGSKGRINFNARKIWINPHYNEDAMTYIHEILHHHFEKEIGEPTSEEGIELLAEMFYAKNPLLCEKIVRQKLQEPRYQSIEDID